MKKTIELTLRGKPERYHGRATDRLLTVCPKGLKSRFDLDDNPKVIWITVSNRRAKGLSYHRVSLNEGDVSLAVLRRSARKISYDLYEDAYDFLFRLFQLDPFYIAVEV